MEITPSDNKIDQNITNTTCAQLSDQNEHQDSREAINIPPLSMSAGRYDQEVHLIKSKYGDLESIRARLNLSKRKVCELLLVDPSSWSRWTTQVGEDAPPYIYRSLQWYLSLIDKDVAWHPMNSFMGLLPKKGESMQLQKLKEELGMVKSRLEQLKNEGAKKTYEDAATSTENPQSTMDLAEEVKALRQMLQNKQDLSSSWKLIVVANLIILLFLLFGANI